MKHMMKKKELAKSGEPAVTYRVYEGEFRKAVGKVFYYKDRLCFLRDDGGDVSFLGDTQPWEMHNGYLWAYAYDEDDERARMVLLDYFLEKERELSQKLDSVIDCVDMLRRCKVEEA